MFFEIAVGDSHFYFVGTVVAILDIVICDFDVDSDIIAFGGPRGVYADDVAALFGLALEVSGFFIQVVAILRGHLEPHFVHPGIIQLVQLIKLSVNFRL